jgi:hypothetical protein
MVLQFLEKMKSLLDYVGGASDELPLKSPGFMQGPLWWGAYWAMLILLLIIFSGQSSKFIYIDF